MCERSVIRTDVQKQKQSQDVTLQVFQEFSTNCKGNRGSSDEKLMQLGILSMLQHNHIRINGKPIDEQRATIGQYAAGNSTAAAVKKPVISSAHHS